MADDANPTVAIPSEGLLVLSGKPETDYSKSVRYGIVNPQCPGLLPWP
jgi:hypothetical protein